MNIKEYLFGAREKLVRSKKNNKESKNEDIVTGEEVSLQTEEVKPKSYLDRKIDEILDNEVKEFFPKTGTWYSNCFRRESDLTMSNLPCHLNNYDWLAKMFRKNRNLIVISEDYIRDYVKTSELFYEAKHNYELEIVNWQIKFMRGGGEGWIIDEELGGDFFSMSYTADLAFRKGVVDTLSAIGMDSEVIEEGIEKNASLWRDIYMNRSFCNEFDSPFLTFNFSLFGEKSDDYDELNKPVLSEIEPEFRDAWMKLRRHEYYQRHKSSVDKYGVVLPEMKLEGEELASLREFVSLKSKERMNDIEEFKALRDRMNQRKNEKRYVK